MRTMDIINDEKINIMFFNTFAEKSIFFRTRDPIVCEIKNLLAVLETRVDTQAGRHIKSVKERERERVIEKLRRFLGSYSPAMKPDNQTVVSSERLQSAENERIREEVRCSRRARAASAAARMESH